MRVYHTLNNEINVKFDIRFCPKKTNAIIRRGRDLMLVGYFFITMQSLPITTNAGSSNPTRARCTRYNIM